MRILGIDPGLRVTGFGVLEKTGTRLAYVTSVGIRSSTSEALAIRIACLPSPASYQRRRRHPTVCGGLCVGIAKKNWLRLRVL